MLLLFVGLLVVLLLLLLLDLMPLPGGVGDVAAASILKGYIVYYTVSKDSAE